LDLRHEVTGRWRTSHNEELHNFNFSSNIIINVIEQRMRWAGHVAHMEEMRYIYRILVGKSEGTRLLRRRRIR